MSLPITKICQNKAYKQCLGCSSYVGATRKTEVILRMLPWQPNVLNVPICKNLSKETEVINKT